MDLELISFLSILFVLLHIFNFAYKIATKETNKLAKIYFKIVSALILWFVIFKLFKYTEITDYGIIFWSIFATAVIWGYTMINQNKDISQKFRAEEKEKTNIAAIAFPHVYKKANQFTNRDIPIYVRFTLYELEKSDKKMIFDSSDYSVINKEFGTFENIQQQLIRGAQFILRNTTYIVESVQVDMVSLFDDYSGGHTKVYEGIDTPYNIQVFADLKQFDK